MPKGKHIILGVHLDDRIREAAEVQNLLTQYGCNIKSRIGLHEVASNFCAGYGMILLEMIGEQKAIQELSDKLDAIEGVEVKQMTFAHA
jgi:metal-responsive CopG/Arc/MetJ family transcriptional regulator